MINLYDKNERSFATNGLVILSDCKSCFITEELNGQFELELEYPLDERGKWTYLVEDNIIKADGQLFRIYHKVKNLASIKVNARHIFYDLLDNLVENLNLVNATGAGALDNVISNTQYSHPFNCSSDVSGSLTKTYAKKNPTEIIMGTDGIIANCGGELVRDNFTIKLLQSRGVDRGVLISYGKNIIGIEETLDLDGICTRLMPIGKDGLLLSEKYIDSPYINNFPHPKIRTVEFSDCEDEATLRTTTQNYIGTSKCDIPQFNYKIDFIELSKTEEYKNYAILETVDMGDTVTIRHNKLNINLKAKVIKIVQNCITGRIENIELGNFKPNLANSINNSIQTVQNDITTTKSSLQLAIDHATEQINSALGGYVVKRNGELLIMDTEDPMTATKVWRWNQNGLGYSSTGYNGQFKTAITADGHIVADFIDTGTLTAILIKTGTLKSQNGSVEFNLDGETFKLGDKLNFDGANLTFSEDVRLTFKGDKGDTGATGAQGAQGIPGSYYAPGWVTSTVVSNGEVVAPFLQGNKIYTSADKSSWLIISGATIQFINNGTEVFRFTIDGADAGKPQLFFNNGCSIDTYEGSLRLRTSSTNYLRINSSGGVDYVNGSNTINLLNPSGTLNIAPVFGS